MKWTAAEIAEFDRLIGDVSSGDQLTRIRGRMRMREFVEGHGKAKCDAMFAHIEAGGAKGDFDDGGEPCPST